MAVITYLRCILLSVDYPDLVHRVLHYLLARPERPNNDASSSRPATLARRRKSESLIRKQAESRDEVSPGLFTLLDMIISGLRSGHQQTITATLGLLGTIHSTWHQYAIPALIRTRNIGIDDSKRSISAHDSNVEALLNMAEEVHDDDCELSYEMHLQDARTLLESHVCSAELLALPSASIVADRRPEKDGRNGWPHQVIGHTIDPADPLLQLMLSHLDKFFANDIESNLTLTQALSILISCGHTNLDGWFLNRLQESDIMDRDEVTCLPNLECTLANNHGETHDDGRSDDSDPTSAKSVHNTQSPVFKSLDNLVNQVNRFKDQIEDFEIYLAERKHVFMVGEDIKTALTNAPALSSARQDSKAGSPSRLRASGVTSISERLLSSENSANVSRASSPRGRQHNTSSAPTVVGSLGHLRISVSPSPSKDSSAAASSPLRRDPYSATPSNIRRNPTGPANTLHQRVRVPLGATSSQPDFLDVASSDVSSIRSESVDQQGAQRKDFVEVSISQILTNVVILREFLLELAAIVEVRAGLFAEVIYN